MKKLFFLVALFSYTGWLHAQDQTVKDLKMEASSKEISKTVDESDTSTHKWKTGALVNLNLSQAALSNWAAGGDNFSFALNSYFNVFAFYKNGKHSWDNNLDLYYGVINSTSLGTRKNDDRFDLTSKYGYKVNSKLNVAALFNFRTQMFEGYDYNESEAKILSSDLLSPAYTLFSLGIDYRPMKNFSLFASPTTSRWIIVKNKILSDQGVYGVDKGKHSKNEIGAYLSANYKVSLSKMITYKGRLDLFSNYKHNPQDVDIFMTNLFAVKLSKVLSATWNIDFIYDDDARLFGHDKNAPALQMKSVVGAGLMVKL